MKTAAGKLNDVRETLVPLGIVVGAALLSVTVFPTIAGILLSRKTADVSRSIP